MNQQVVPDRASEIHEAKALGHSRRAKLRRRAARAFALLAATAMIIDAAPSSWKWLAKPKRAASVVLDRVGLWQGEWSMFAPDPVINNGWFSAEIEEVDGSQSQWNSPYWSEVSSSDKFLRFRYLNYFNRLPGSWYRAAREDFADYLARQSPVPVESVRLYHSRVRLLMPEDGSLPKRDEVDWMFVSELVVRHTYPPSGSGPSGSEPIRSQPRISPP